MKLGIFGDSFASFSGKDDRFVNWPTLLSNKLNLTETGFYGRSGTSHWYSFLQFKEHFLKYDVIVFCHTMSMRWPVLPEGSEGAAWNIGFIKDKRVDLYNSIRKDIISEDLLNFLCSNIFREINSLCKTHNKYLVSIFTSEPLYELVKTKYPILLNLEEISRSERIRIHGQDKKLVDMNKELIIGDKIPNDLRECHLNNHNNIILSNLLYDIIYKKVFNTKINLVDFKWEKYDITVDKKYEESINNR